MYGGEWTDAPVVLTYQACPVGKSIEKRKEDERRFTEVVSALSRC